MQSPIGFLLGITSILSVLLDPGVAAAQEAVRPGIIPDVPPHHVNLFVTDKAFLRRTIEPRFEVIGDAAGDQYRESVLLAWTISRRLGIETEASLVQFDAEFGGGSSAFGGIEVTPKVSILQDDERRLLLAAASGFEVPVGDQDEWLANHGWKWKPRLLLWKGWDAEGRSALQMEFGSDMTSAGSFDPDPVLVFNAGYSRWTSSNWIPVVEITAIERLGPEDSDGATPVDPSGILTGLPDLRASDGVFRDTEGIFESDERLLAGTLGFRYALTDGQQWGAGFRFPFFGDTESFEWGLIVGGTIRLP
ncbi:MAG TPA: hypothetical protein VFH11_01320 [Gemmatimonadota bacterium]|nr:hypothetical protein [Gemmatimonadota bacterium]